MLVFTVELLPLEQRSLLKWKISSVTPNIVRQTITRSHFKVTKSKPFYFHLLIVYQSIAKKLYKCVVLYHYTHVKFLITFQSLKKSLSLSAQKFYKKAFCFRES